MENSKHRLAEVAFFSEVAFLSVYEGGEKTHKGWSDAICFQEIDRKTFPESHL